MTLYKVLNLNAWKESLPDAQSYVQTCGATRDFYKGDDDDDNDFDPLDMYQQLTLQISFFAKEGETISAQDIIKNWSDGIQDLQRTIKKKASLGEEVGPFLGTLVLHMTVQAMMPHLLEDLEKTGCLRRLETPPSVRRAAPSSKTERSKVGKRPPERNEGAVDSDSSLVVGRFYRQVAKGKRVKLTENYDDEPIVTVEDEETKCSMEMTRGTFLMNYHPRSIRRLLFLNKTYFNFVGSFSCFVKFPRMRTHAWDGNLQNVIYLN